MTKNELKMLGFKYNKEDDTYTNKSINTFAYREGYWYAEDLEKMSVGEFLHKVYNDGYFTGQKDIQSEIKRLLDIN